MNAMRRTTPPTTWPRQQNVELAVLIAPYWARVLATTLFTDSGR